jgi:transposase
MLVIGIDAHKRSHTAVRIDDNGRLLATKTVGTTTQDHLRLVKWAGETDGERLWAIEDCRHLTRRLERDLIAAGESVVRVPPKLMAHIRDSARTYGKSDPIDALAVARAAPREPDLPLAHLDSVERELRLLVDHREDLVAERTRIISRLRWHLHELHPGWTPPTKIDRTSAFDTVTAHLKVTVTTRWCTDWHCGSSNTCGCSPSRSTSWPPRSPNASRSLHRRCWPSLAAVR